MVEFDFEKDVERMLPKISDDTLMSEIGSFKVGDQKHRIIVCRHWLQGLCFNGINCSYLHRLDRSKMPPCKHGKQCKIKHCPLKHVADEELEECQFYKQGFCYNGTKCPRRHLKRTPEECPPEAYFEPVIGATGQPGKKARTGQPNDNYKVTLCTHWLLNNSACPFGEECHYAHGEEDINEGYQPNAEFLNDYDIYDPTRGRLESTLELPFPQQSRYSFFILQAPDLRSLTISRRKNIWAVPSRLIGEMNAAFRSSDHVIIYFSVRPLRGIYGVARLAAPINSGPGLLSPEFQIQWLRTMRISLRTVAQLKLGSSGMFVGRSPTDGRFENRVGLDMLLTAYRKPIWDWSQEIEVAERNIRLVDTGVSHNLGEYFPASRCVPYFLPPDSLFAQDWVDRAAMAVNEKGVLIPQAPGSYQAAPRAAQDSLGNVENYTGSAPGFVVCAGPAEIEEMIGRLLCGLPIDFKDKIEMIQPGIPIFIFDWQMQVMLGLYYAVNKPSLNVEPAAFLPWGANPSTAKSNLPVQFAMRPAFDCPPVPVPMQDPELYNALGEHAQSLGQIGLPHTKALVKIFCRRARQAFPTVGPYMAGGAGAKKNVNRGPPGGPAGGPGAGPGGTGYYKPPFRCVDVVPVNLEGVNLFELKKRLLGHNAISIMNIVDSVASKHTMRIRIRGMGSGFVEGPNQEEYPEPLHFNICADNEQLLQAGKEKLEEHIRKVKVEFYPGRV